MAEHGFTSHAGNKKVKQLAIVARKNKHRSTDNEKNNKSSIANLFFSVMGRKGK